VDSKQAAKQWQALVWPHLAAVLRVARILSEHAADAEDLAQETMFKSYRSFETFKQGSDVKAWLMTILRNTWRDRMRLASSRETIVSLEDELIEAQEEPSREALDWEKICENPEEILNEISDQQIIDALRDFPVELRWTLLLVDVEGMDHEETAQLMGVPVGTVKSRAHRGRALLRQALLPIARERRLIRD
jgi:RNA polymerase sigma-70 factor (ECF subfamily)